MAGEVARHSEGHRRVIQRPVLITGGAGFIGSNLAHHFLSTGRSVLIFDNLSRRGVKENLRWLRAAHGPRVLVEVADIRDARKVLEAVRRASLVFHLAGQVSVVKSLSDPIGDFEVNLNGTLNVLNALRRLQDPPPMLFSSTNKVYGDLRGVKVVKSRFRYRLSSRNSSAGELDMIDALDFCSPYACSKGAADQYVLDHARSFGLRTVVLRLSCIYGPRQFGNEGQGWIAHFINATIRGRPITIYGDGLQVRDVLFVEDLVRAMVAALDGAGGLWGRAFDIGGGPPNTVSLLELINLIEDLHGERPEVTFGAWRRGDQRYYVSDTNKFRRATGWKPLVNLQEGLRRLYDWLCRSRRQRFTSVD